MSHKIYLICCRFASNPLASSNPLDNRDPLTPPALHTGKSELLCVPTSIPYIDFMAGVGMQVKIKGRQRIKEEADRIAAFLYGRADPVLSSSTYVLGIAYPRSCLPNTRTCMDELHMHSRMSWISCRKGNCRGRLLCLVDSLSKGKALLLEKSVTYKLEYIHYCI